MKLPIGGRDIADLRAIGKAPADMVLVSLIGNMRGEINPVVIASGSGYDWIFLNGLNVMIVANMQTDREKIVAVMNEILAIEPSYLGIVWADKGDGLNIAWGAYRPKAACIRKWSAADRRAWNGSN